MSRADKSYVFMVLWLIVANVAEFVWLQCAANILVVMYGVTSIWMELKYGRAY